MSKEPDGEAIRYELLLGLEEAERGVKRILTRNGKRLEVTIPPGTGNGYTVRLINALQITDGRPGDILITVKIKPAETAAGVQEIDDSSFEREVLNSSLPVVVDFWAPWCGPCRMIAPVMERLSAQFTNRMKFCKINVDENPQTAAQFHAMSIPLLIFFKEGVEVDRSVGALPESALRSKVEEVLA